MKIFIDAGHNYNGWDTGATGNDLREQDITWAVGNLVRQKLQSLGVQVAVSRERVNDILGTDVNSSLAVRAAMSDSFGADYCISIHCNAGGGTGTETYIVAKGGKAEQLAIKVNNSLVKMGLVNRGVKVSNYYMVRKPKAPAILIELAFIDNKNDAEILKNKQNELANAITSAICSQIGIEWKEVTKTMTVGEAIAKLVEKGVINSPEYWEMAAGIVFNLDKLLINMALKL